MVNVIKKIIIGAGLAIMLLGGGALGLMYFVSQPTKGPAIENYANPRKALLVIDIQEDFTGKTARQPFPYKNSEELIANSNRVIEKAQAKGMTVIYIRQEFGGFIGTLISKFFVGGTVLEGSSGAAVDSRIKIVSPNNFSKPRSDSFSSEAFERFLVANRINELYLAGLDGEACVYRTALGALNRKYKVHVITDAIVLFKEENRPALFEKFGAAGITMLKSTEFLK